MQRYAITDRSLLPPHPQGMEAALCEQVQKWVQAGIEWVQLREKDLPGEALGPLVSRLLSVTRAPGSRTRLLVNLGSGSNSYPDSGLSLEHVLAWGADGVHLAGSVFRETIRRTVELACHVSVSCHTLAEVQAARDGGATLALWAPVFGKRVCGEQVVPGTGLSRLREACRQAMPMPVFALGGVSAADTAACMQAGAAGVAGIRLFHEGASWDHAKSALA